MLHGTDATEEGKERKIVDQLIAQLVRLETGKVKNLMDLEGDKPEIEMKKGTRSPPFALSPTNFEQVIQVIKETNNISDYGVLVVAEWQEEEMVISQAPFMDWESFEKTARQRMSM